MPAEEEVKPAAEMDAQQQPEQEQQKAETVTLSREEFEKMQKALKDANNEAAKRRKELEEKSKAEMTEIERLKKERDDAAAELAVLKANEIKRRIAAAVKLPEALALRIQGATEEEMEADAKAILAALPKAPAQSPNPANPGANGRTGETDAERRRRLLG